MYLLLSLIRCKALHFTNNLKKQKQAHIASSSQLPKSFVFFEHTKNDEVQLPLCGLQLIYCTNSTLN